MQLEGELSTEKISLSRRKYPGFLRGGVQIVRQEGIRGLYKGLTASLMREGSYSSIRLGLYDPMKQLFGATDPANTPLYKKVLAGACTGALGSALANPTDLVKIRMQSDSVKRYSTVMSAFREIATKEGIVSGLWRGVGATTQRAALLTATQIPSYDHSKYFFLNHGLLQEGVTLHMVCSMFAGFMTATITSPVDVVKTRIMNQQTKGPYNGTLDACRQIVQTEGIGGLYKGWFPNWMRIGPHTIVALMIFEQLRAIAGIRPV